MFHLKVEDISCIGAARRAALVLCNELDISEQLSSHVAIVVSELCTNLMRYANATGEILLRILTSHAKKGLEIIALDKGPGLSNISQALSDGYSSANNTGTGLGAIIRLSTNFNIYSAAGMGTIIAVRFGPYPASDEHTLDGLETSGVCVAKSGESVSGDAWLACQSEERHLILVADGLGHGPDAAVASQLACQTFLDNKESPLTQIVLAINKALKRTRGAAMAIAEINPVQKTVRYAGLGNISGAIIMGNETFHMISQDGTAGLGHFNIHESSYPWHAEATLVMHSDGLSRWDLTRYPGLSVRHPNLIAGMLYRDFNRGYDDTTVVVARAASTKS